jgi:Cu(I)/Ag(I) efflux system membrane fusion protein
LIIELKEPGGAPVSDVAINAYAEMSSMGTMPAMRAPAGMQKVAPGRFEGKVELAMRGEWPLTIEVKDSKHGDQRLQFDLATDREGLTLAAGAKSIGRAAVKTEDSSNVITIDSRRWQMIGVKTGKVTNQNLVKKIRAVGEVKFDERLFSNVTLKFDGYIGDLKANYVGAPIKKGQVLFTVYSPELLAAQQEYLQTLKHRKNRKSEDTLLRAARQRLALWDMTSREIQALEKRGTPKDYISIYAPRTGTLIKRHITDGSAARMGQTLLTIADLSRVWIEAEVFEADLELVHVGMTATVTLPYLPKHGSYPAKVEYVYPYLKGDSRTGRIRMSLENLTGNLKPDMYTEVSLEVDLGDRLSVPEEAIIVAGKSRVVFIDLGEGRLKPVWIKTGRRVQGFVEVLEGLSPGDTVVTSGNFLIAAETRLKTGIKQW